MNPTGERITARVAGNYGNYEVTIRDGRENLDAYCDCPYDGYPCKHIVAVCLCYMKNRNQYQSIAKAQGDLQKKIEDELSKRSKQELIDLLMKVVDRTPEFQSMLVFHLFPNTVETENALVSRIDVLELDDFYDDYRSEADKVRYAKELLRDVEQLSPRIKVVVSWRLADKVLRFLNNYGVDDERWENVVLDILEEITPLLRDEDSLSDLKKEIHENLIAYYDWGNCGLIDAIGDYAQDLSN